MVLKSYNDITCRVFFKKCWQKSPLVVGNNRHQEFTEEGESPYVDVLMQGRL